MLVPLSLPGADPEDDGKLPVRLGQDVLPVGLGGHPTQERAATATVVPQQRNRVSDCLRYSYEKFTPRAQNIANKTPSVKTEGFLFPEHLAPGVPMLAVAKTVARILRSYWRSR